MKELIAHEVIGNKELYAIWPKIKEGLEQIDNKCTGVIYRPEDIYYEIKTGNVRLITGIIDNIYQGFIILSEKQFPDGKGLHIWMGYYNGDNDELDFMKKFYAKIDELAATIGAVRVSYSSSRSGFLRAVQRFGYKPVSHLYYFEKELT